MKRLDRGLIAAVVLLAATAAVMVWMGIAGQALQVEQAPRGGLSLQMPLNTTTANQIVRVWREKGLTPRAESLLTWDTRLFVPLYTATLIAAIVWGARRAGISWRIVALMAAVVIVGAAADLIENMLLMRQLQAAAGEEASTRLVALTRAAAQVKFIALLGGFLAAVVVSGAALRLAATRGGRRRMEGAAAGRTPKTGTFRELAKAETKAIFRQRPTAQSDDPTISAGTPEPRIAFRSADLVGVALSGGGIRSASFNLGILQQLAECDVLRLVDYISTVSGGGYVGGFLSAWLRRHYRRGKTTEASFPSPSGGAEAGEVRHIREFSRFLAPRWGFFEVEMWRAIVAVLAGLIPALAIALSLIGISIVIWLCLTFPHACDWRAAAALSVAGMTALALWTFERWWGAVKARGSTPQRAQHTYRWTACVALVLVAAVQFVIPTLYQRWSGYRIPVRHEARFQPAKGEGAYERWWDLIGVAQIDADWFMSPRLFDFAIAWTTVAVVLLVARLIFATGPFPWARERLEAFDRVIMRLLGLAVLWLGVTAIWHLCVNLPALAGRLIAGTLVSGATFAALRNWIGVALRRPPTRTSRLARLGPHVPQVLAYVTLILAIGATGSVLIMLNRNDWFAWFGGTAGMAVVVALGLFIDPANFGLHAFYRDRLGRAFLGAARSADAAANRSTEYHGADDIRLRKLPERPLHLVCCAANDLSGDPVETLARGCRSATLSRCGVAVGDRYVEPGDLTLGSALTASAAAFNSNMGAVSMRVGPAVGFLMTALNLRLGLWVRHPGAGLPSPRRWPGLLLYREMFGLTSVSGAVGSGTVPLLQRDVHLSDGGHFENLALYELVRRHCRYIILSDCGADEGIAFDDLGNAFRRIREDFGVEIDIDVEPLRPEATGWSQQHLAIGTIKYSSVDHGVLIYIKPTLTGDEPPDVRQYKTRNPAFPHESTTDQFYDEAQWESYRRLGQHAAERVFAFLKEEGREATLTADFVFSGARYAWYPTPPGLRQKVLEMTKRFGQPEMELSAAGRKAILREIIPEAEFLLPPSGSTTPATATHSDGRDVTPHEDEIEKLFAVLRVAQLMEDVWIACELDRHWAHPLNLGWVNLFARWATAPSFRRWWPLLAAMYTPRFRRFLEHRFSVTSETLKTSQAINEVEATTAGLAANWWHNRSPQPRNWDGRKLFAYSITLDGEPVTTVQLGLAAVAEAGPDVGWTSEDLFVPPSLWGAGFGYRFIQLLLDRLAEKHHACFVCVRSPSASDDNAIARDDEVRFVEQYRRLHFRQLAVPYSGVVAARLRELDIEPRKGDTLLVLDLNTWKRLRQSAPPPG